MPHRLSTASSVSSVQRDASLSMRTKNPCSTAGSRTRRRLSIAVARSMSRPICVSFTEMLRLIPALAAARIRSAYARAAASAVSIDVTDSPSRSIVAANRCASIAWTAASASSARWPATTRRAKLSDCRMP